MLFRNFEMYYNTCGVRRIKRYDNWIQIQIDLYVIMYVPWMILTYCSRSFENVTNKLALWGYKSSIFYLHLHNPLTYVLINIILIESDRRSRN